MIYYILLGVEVMFMMWFASWFYISQSKRIYALTHQQETKQNKRLLQWEVFTTIICSAIFLYTLLRVLLSPAL